MCPVLMWLLHNNISDQALAEISRRVERLFGFAPFPSQLHAATALLRKEIVELETGQGKTVTGGMAAVLQAQAGRRVWISTANDYLARRDAEWMRPLYESFGLRVGVIAEDVPQSERRRHYEADVVYGTLREFGFDYLRSRLAERHASRTNTAALFGQDPFHNALIVDEADSLLIDEAVIPLVLSQPSAEHDPATAACFQWAASETSAYHRGVHYEFLASGHAVALTPAGREQFLIRPMPSGGERFSQNDLIDHLERALLVDQRYQRDRDYLIRDGQVRIVDEFTGRSAEGRSWSAGVHQAIEAREQLPLTRPAQPAARITVQEFATRFQHLSGMTGTAAEAAREFRAVYGLRVRRIPPHQSSRRIEEPPLVVRTLAEKWSAVAEEAGSLTRAGRAVLIGTRTVEASEQLSDEFAKRGLVHVVLNARQPDREAEIVAAAGQPGRVTIATNMAGRGTDIRLADTVRAAGGLHVIITELNGSPRIDRQLAGRCGRQGDPGSHRLILSAADPIVALAFGKGDASSPRTPTTIRRLRQAQRLIERNQRESRLLLRMSAERRAKDAATLGLDPIVDPMEE